MKVALIQTNIIWESPLENRTILEQKMNSIIEKVDLIVLPEMFTSGFTMHPENVAETMNGTTISWLQSIAKSKNTAIAGSLVIFENKKYYNRMVFIHPYGEITYYNKRHLFSLANENEYYTSGDSKVVLTYLGFKICLQICYDLRFPVFSRNTEGYDLLLYVANWPTKRIQAWTILLKARAVENVCYTIGVNRVGVDANKLEYNGHSQTIDFQGNCMTASREDESVFIVNLDKKKQDVFREKFPFLNDRDSFIFQ
jgi:omega-amidase